MSFQFDPTSLTTNDFSPSAALSTAHLAHLAYQDAEALHATAESHGLSLLQHESFSNPFSFEATQGFALELEDRMVLVFRGSDEKADWLLNLKIAKTAPWNSTYAGRVHKGFHQGLELVWEKAVAPFLAHSKDKPITVVGHSLGGALAVLAAHRIGKERLASLFTFGQPLAGDRRFARAQDERSQKRYFRIVNDRDIVARIPPRPIYQHAGLLKFLNREGELIDGTDLSLREEVHPSRPLTIEEFKALQEELRASRGPLADRERELPPIIADHLVF
ncbi:MAG: lipase family protein [Verrucomicrobiota bacterium]